MGNLHNKFSNVTTKKLSKRILSLLLALTLVFGMTAIGFSASAASGDECTVELTLKNGAKGDLYIGTSEKKLELYEGKTTLDKGNVCVKFVGDGYVLNKQEISNSLDGVTWSEKEDDCFTFNAKNNTNYVNLYCFEGYNLELDKDFGKFTGIASGSYGVDLYDAEKASKLKKLTPNVVSGSDLGDRDYFYAEAGSQIAVDIASNSNIVKALDGALYFADESGNKISDLELVHYKDGYKTSDNDGFYALWIGEMPAQKATLTFEENSAPDYYYEAITPAHDPDAVEPTYAQDMEISQSFWNVEFSENTNSNGEVDVTITANPGLVLYEDGEEANWRKAVENDLFYNAAPYLNQLNYDYTDTKDDFKAAETKVTASISDLESEETVIIADVEYVTKATFTANFGSSAKQDGGNGGTSINSYYNDFNYHIAALTNLGDKALNDSIVTRKGVQILSSDKLSSIGTLDVNYVTGSDDDYDGFWTENSQAKITVTLDPGYDYDVDSFELKGAYNVDNIYYNDGDDGKNYDYGIFALSNHAADGSYLQWVVSRVALASSTNISQIYEDLAVVVKATATPEEQYAVNIVDGIRNGIVTADKEAAVAGDVVMLSVLPDEGYKIADVMVKDANGEAIEVKPIVGSEEFNYSFEMPASDVLVSAKIIQQDMYEVIVADSVGGTVVASPTTIAAGETVALTIEAEEGYEFDVVNSTIEDSTGNPVGLIYVSAESYIFIMPEADVFITPVFKEIVPGEDYTITIGYGDNGSLDVVVIPANVASNDIVKKYAKAGDEVLVTAVPDEGYELDMLLVVDEAGENIETLVVSQDTISFIMPASNVGIGAIFKEIVEPESYSVIIADGIYNGTVTANKEQAVEGDTITLTATPNEGYKFDSWIVLDNSGNSITVTDNQFIMPASDVYISAVFAEDPVPPTDNGWKETDGKWQYLVDGVALTDWHNDIPGWEGQWFFFDRTTGYAKSAWAGDIPGWEGQWFYFNPKTCVMMSGWVNDGANGNDGNWYFLDATTGVMKTGWHLLPWSGGINWFFFNDQGHMLANTTISGIYVLDANGVWIP